MTHELQVFFDWRTHEGETLDLQAHPSVPREAREVCLLRHVLLNSDSQIEIASQSTPMNLYGASLLERKKIMVRKISGFISLSISRDCRVIYYR